MNPECSISYIAYSHPDASIMAAMPGDLNSNSIVPADREGGREGEEESDQTSTTVRVVLASLRLNPV